MFECHPGERNIDGKKQHPVSYEARAGLEPAPTSLYLALLYQAII
jgi:hypothetical protein